MILFLNIGGGEMILIMLVVLMLFGAESFPKIARTVGRGIRQVKDATNEIQEDIKKSANDIKKEMNGDNLVTQFKKEIESDFKEEKKTETEPEKSIKS